jgi:RNA polymerase sigma factor (sigma-70 family)
LIIIVASNLETRLKSMMLLALNGDTKAYNALLLLLASWLRVRCNRLFSRYGQAAHEAEDMVQEVLLAIHLKRHTWHTSEAFLPWVASILKYKTIDKLRKRAIKTEFLSDEILNETLDEQEETSFSSQVSIEDLLLSLPKQQQEIIRLVMVNGLSQQEAAKQLNLEPGTMRVNLHRAIQKLSTLFKVKQEA